LTKCSKLAPLARDSKLAGGIGWPGFIAPWVGECGGRLLRDPRRFRTERAFPPHELFSSLCRQAIVNDLLPNCRGQTQLESAARANDPVPGARSARAPLQRHRPSGNPAGQFGFKVRGALASAALPASTGAAALPSPSAQRVPAFPVAPAACAPYVPGRRRRSR